MIGRGLLYYSAHRRYTSASYEPVFVRRTQHCSTKLKLFCIHNESI